MSVFWKNIFEQEKNHLRNGQFRRGERFCTPSDLARQYGVNYLTAQRVLKELTEAHYLIKTATGEFQVAGIGQKTKIYFLAPGPAFTRNVHSSSWMLMQQGVFEEALQLNLQIVPISFEECQELTENEEGILLFISGSTRFFDDVFLKLLPATVFPISINAWCPPQRGIAIGSDNTRMMRDLTNYFISQGYRRIGYIGDTSEIRYERFEGYYQAITQAGTKFTADLAYTLWQVEHINILEITQYLERGKWDAVCTPCIDCIDFIEQNVAPSIFDSMAWGSIGKPNAICPKYSYVQPDYIGQGNCAVRLALEVDPGQNYSPRYCPIAATLHTL